MKYFNTIGQMFFYGTSGVKDVYVNKFSWYLGTYNMIFIINNMRELF